MKSPNEQYLIAQELTKLESNCDYPSYNIHCYKVDVEYQIAISSNIGMFPGVYIECIIELSERYGYNWYVSDSCSADLDGSLFIIIF